MLVLVMYATGMLGMVVMSGDREKDVRAIVSVMHEIGVGGLNLEIIMDNESSLQSVVNAALLKSNCRSFHPKHVSVARLQAKRLEQEDTNRQPPSRRPFNAGFFTSSIF